VKNAAVRPPSVTLQIAQIRLLAERQKGTFLHEMPKAPGTKGQLHGSRSGGAVVELPESAPATLAEIGITTLPSA
jgi:hypothetical protein